MLLLRPAAALEPAPEPFSIARIHLEQNATDGDFEAVVEVKGGDDGLASLEVESPAARKIIQVTAPAATTLGVRQLRFESPEPGDFSSLKAAYPAGVYTFTGTTAGGGRLEGKATLSHVLPAAAAVLRPAPGARDVAAEGLVISWTGVRNIVAYIVTIEQRGRAISLEARLPAPTVSFAVPDAFLTPGTDYQLAIGAVTRDGNIAFAETTFTTAAKE